MAEPKLTTPVAIIVAGALIGVGAFFGMRARPAVTATTPAPGSTNLVAGTEATTSRDVKLAPPQIKRASSPGAADSASATDPPAVELSAAPVAPSTAPIVAEERARVIDEVKRTFEALRPALIERCWKPAIKAQPEPRSARVTFNFGFAADGQQLSRGVMEDRRSHRVGLSSCLSDAIPMFPVAAPGVSTYVEVPFELP